MPNTPAQVREGMSVWTATIAVTDAQRAQTQAILGALGHEVAVENEGYVDMATAVSGSGPAYVFLFIEALADAGVQMGLPRAVAETLAMQTVRGSAIYAQESGQHPAVPEKRRYVARRHHRCGAARTGARQPARHNHTGRPGSVCQGPTTRSTDTE
jgi:pyrroline-5-carboxylate reductase